MNSANFDFHLFHTDRTWPNSSFLVTEYMELRMHHSTCNRLFSGNCVSAQNIGKKIQRQFANYSTLLIERVSISFCHLIESSCMSMLYRFESEMPA